MRKKLTVEQVAEILKAYGAGESQSVIGLRYGLTQGTVSKITQGVSYRFAVKRPLHRDWRDVLASTASTASTEWELDRFADSVLPEVLDWV